MIITIGLLLLVGGIVVYFTAYTDSWTETIGLAVAVVGIVMIVGGCTAQVRQTKEDACRAAGGVPVLVDSRSNSYSCTDKDTGKPLDIDGVSSWMEER